MADIVTFDPAYFQELAKNLENASKSLNDAKTGLQKATVGLDSGLVAFALCSVLNSDIKNIQKNAAGSINAAGAFSKVLLNGVVRVNGWETTTKNRESGLAAQLGKTWGFEGGNFEGSADPVDSTNWRLIDAGDPPKKPFNAEDLLTVWR
jgi:hypothetical protein